MGEDGRADNPGHCHADIRIIDEEAFPVSPRTLLKRLGHSALAQAEHLSAATFFSAVSFDIATGTFYNNWPE